MQLPFKWTRWILLAAFALLMFVLGFVGRNLISPPQGLKVSNDTSEVIIKIEWHYESKYSGAWIASRSTLRVRLAPGQTVFLAAPGTGEFGYEVNAETVSGRRTKKLAEGYALGRQHRSLVFENSNR
jgi:hypothetical protein